MLRRCRCGCRYHHRPRRPRLARPVLVNRAAGRFSPRFCQLLVLRGGCVHGHVRLHQSEPRCVGLNQNGEWWLLAGGGGGGGGQWSLNSRQHDDWNDDW